jgi:hypothetical protein
LRIAKAIIKSTATQETLQDYLAEDSASAMWKKITLKAHELKGEKEALYVQQMEGVTFNERRGWKISPHL